MPVDIKTSTAVPTADYININVDAAVNVKISNEADKLQLAAQNFLNQPTDYIARVAREVLEGNMREIVGRMNLQEMVSDRQKFAELVKENAGRPRVYGARCCKLQCAEFHGFQRDHWRPWYR
ncbi:MAG: flotillin family protein [Christensenellaceae bacterium]